MEVIPAIDLRGGRCVRLYQGDFARETVFSDDPLGVALQWQEQGAPRLHIVDLDGAATGIPVNLEVVKDIASRVAIPLQMGGGIRTMEAASKVQKKGVARLVVGTAAVEDPALVEELLRTCGAQAVVVSVDARDGLVAIRGWQERSTVPALDLAKAMVARGVARLLYTDISRDGTLTEPNFSNVAQMVERAGVPILASGGITSLEHLRRLADLGVEGAVVGRALYTGAMNLREAVTFLG